MKTILKTIVGGTVPAMLLTGGMPAATAGNDAAATEAATQSATQPGTQPVPPSTQAAARFDSSCFAAQFAA